MPDFYQHAQLPTLHHLADSDLMAREVELAVWAKERPIALLLPALGLEFTKQALPRMLREVAGVPYVDEVVIVVNHATSSQIEKARAQCETLLGEKRFTLLWNNGPTLQAFHRSLRDHCGTIYTDGKGSNVWTGLAYLAARGQHRIVASHDTDILSYERGMLWRLCYPVAHPELSYDFAKGYYGRVGDRLFGRMTRLLISPLLQAFIDVLGRTDLLDYLEAFRYPLSGEFCATLDTLGRFGMPQGWGLEMCLLCETQRHLPRHRACQVDLGFNFEHRHRTVSNAPAATAATEGLTESAIQVVQTLTSHLMAKHEPTDVARCLKAVHEHYNEVAAQWVPRYQHDAMLNGLRYDADDERHAVTVFGEALKQAFALHEDPKLAPLPGFAKLFTERADLKQAILAAS